MSGYRVVFKHEDEVAGEPVGPVVVYSAAELELASREGSLGVPYDPNRVERWVTRTEALAVAAEYAAKLEEDA